MSTGAPIALLPELPSCWDKLVKLLSGCLAQQGPNCVCTWLAVHELVCGYHVSSTCGM